MFGRKIAESGKDNLKSILSPVHITLEFLTWDRQMFQYKSIQRLLSKNYQNVVKEIELEWPKMAKDLIVRLDRRINDQNNDHHDDHHTDLHVGHSTLAPDLQRRLVLRYSWFYI